MKPDNLLHDEAPASKYFHVLPNMYDDDLNPYEYRLIGHYKRVGTSWEGVRKTAEKCGMSVGKVTKTRKDLEAKELIKVQMLTRKDLKDRGLVNDAHPDDKNKICVVTVVDVMEQNVARYKSATPVHEVNTPVHHVNIPVHDVNERITNEVEPLKKKKEPKGSGDIESIIKGWLDGQTTQPVTNQYGNKGVRANAKAMAGKFTPEQVTAYVKELASQAYWNGKLIGIGYVANNIAAHYAAKKPAAINPAHIPFPAVEENLDIVPMPAEAIEARKALARSMSDNEGIKYAKPA